MSTRTDWIYELLPVIAIVVFLAAALGGMIPLFIGVLLEDNRLVLIGVSVLLGDLVYAIAIILFAVL